MRFFNLIFWGFSIFFSAQNTLILEDIKNSVSQDRLEEYVQKLVDFKTRHTLSDTLSTTEGIGAARRWIYDEFQKNAEGCYGCLDISIQKNFFPKDNKRLTQDVWINNVIAFQKGQVNPNHVIIITGDIDSRVSDVKDASSISPGANDNATGMAACLEVARILCLYSFSNSILYAGLSGEEQGLYGGQGLAKYIEEQGWEVIGVINNDMIGNIQGIDGVIDNRSFRIFSEPHSPILTEKERNLMRYYGGDQDGKSRQLARKVYSVTKEYMPIMNPVLINRLDRFGRGGHHKPFSDKGLAGIRIMEMHENYNWQHQDIRTENGIEYGDKIEHVNFPYCKKMTQVNLLSLAYIASAPLSPKNVIIQGAVSPSTTLYWEKVKDAIGYTVVWRDTTSPTWQYSKYVGDVSEYTLEGWVIDNYQFGVEAVNKEGFKSIVAYPNEVR